MYGDTEGVACAAALLATCWFTCSHVPRRLSRCRHSQTWREMNGLMTWACRRALRVMAAAVDLLYEHPAQTVWATWVTNSVQLICMPRLLSWSRARNWDRCPLRCSQRWILVEWQWSSAAISFDYLFNGRSVDWLITLSGISARCTVPRCWAASPDFTLCKPTTCDWTC